MKMDADRPRRTMLYLPASNVRAVEKARSLAADVLLLDLEDAVAPDAKDAARAAAVAAVASGFGEREAGIRVNGFGTDWAAADFAAVAASAADFLVVPKVESADDASRAVALAGGKPVLAMIETPRAVWHALAIAEVAGIEGLIAGFNDLAKDLRARVGTDRLPLLHSASAIVLAARAAGILAFDGVFASIPDTAGLEAEARQGLALGFDGKTCIHPGQLETVNRVFTPSAGEVEEARGLIAAHAEAMAAGRAVATFRGRLVETLHVREAEGLLARAARIARNDGFGSGH